MNKEIEVSKPQNEILTSTKSLNLFLAGAGSGKTHCAGFLSADFVVNYPKAVGFIGANTFDQLSKSTLKRIFEVWYEEFKWRNDVEYVVDKIPPANFKKLGIKLKSYNNTISFNNGCTIFTSSLDNYKAIDGTEIGWALLDETKDTKEEALKDVIMWRLRQKAIYIDENGVLYDYFKPGTKGYNPLYIFTSPAKVDWINEWFELSDKYEEISKKIFSKTDFYNLESGSKKVVISSTYHNEHNLPPGYIDEKLQQFKGNQDKIDMLIYGSPIAKTGGEWLSQFNRLKHVGKVPFIKGHNVHITLDFNVVPYITMLCFQIVKKDNIYEARFFQELCLSSPENNTEDLCKKFDRDFFSVQNEGKETGLFYYGDASGKNRSTRSKENDFEILERVLGKYLSDESNRVLKRNPALNSSRMFLNKVYAEGLNIRILIDESCKNLISDCEFVKEAPDGDILVEHVKDKLTGQTYEKRGHCMAAKRYGLIGAFFSLYEDFINNG